MTRSKPLWPPQAAEAVKKERLDLLARHDEQGPNSAELAAAYLGDLTPLLQKYPQLEPVLRLPKLARGKSFWAIKKKKLRQNSHDHFVLNTALKDVIAIRRLWKKYYNRSNRKRDETSAEWFAAKRWEWLTDGDYKAAGLIDVLIAAKKR